MDLGTRPLCAPLRAGTDVTERWANPSQPALGARMTVVAQPHTPSNYYYYYYYCYYCFYCYCYCC